MHAGVNLNHQESVSGHLNNGLLEVIQNSQAITKLIQLLQRLVPNNANAANSSTFHVPLNVNVTNSTSSYGLNENGLNDTACQPTVTPQTRIPDRQDCSYLPRKRNKPDLFNEEKIITSWFIKFKIYVQYLSEEVKLGNLIMLLDGKPLDDLGLYPELLKSYEDLVKHLQHNYNQKESRDSAARELQLHLRTKPKRINDLDEYATKLEKLVDIIERGSSKESIMRRKLDLLVDSVPNECKSKCVSIRHSAFREAVTYLKTIWNYDLTAALSTKSNNSILNRNRPPNSNGRDKFKRHGNSNEKENFQVICHGCGKIGNIRPRCLENSSNRKTGNNIIRTKPYCLENIPEKIEQLKNQKLTAIEVQVNDINVVALCDTGTNVMTVHSELVNHLGLKKDKLIHIGRIAGGKAEKMSNQPLTKRKETIFEDEFVKIIKHKFPNAYAKFSGDVGPGKVYVEKMNFELQSPESMKMYPIPENLKDEHTKLVKQMLELDIIEPSTSTKIHPTLLLQKPGTSEYRFLFDGRLYNQLMIEINCYPNHANKIFLELKDFNHISKIDLSNAFH